MVYAQEAKTQFQKEIEESSDRSQKRCTLEAQKAMPKPSTVCICSHGSECSG